MKELTLALIITSLISISSFAKVGEYSPTKVLVDEDKAVVLREPSLLDYDHAILDKKTSTKDRSVMDRILRKKCGARRFHL